MQEFSAIKIQHTPRFCNAITHFLTKLTLEKGETVVWEGLFPSEVMYLFQSIE